MLVEEAGTLDAVDAEAAEILPELAPGADQADIDVIGDRNRPDRPVRPPALFIAIVDRHLARLVDRAADLGEVDAGRARGAALRHIERRLGEVTAQHLGE